MTPGQTVKRYLQKIQEDLIAEQKAKGMRVSGESARSLDNKVKRSGDDVRGQLTGADYWEDQEKGGKPVAQGGRVADVDDIAEWMKDRGIAANEPQSAKDAVAELITFRLNKYGWRKDGKRIDLTGIVRRNEKLMLIDLNVSAVEQFRSQIIDAYK